MLFLISGFKLFRDGVVTYSNLILCILQHMLLCVMFLSIGLETSGYHLNSYCF